MPTECRHNLQISLREKIAAPTCVHGLMPSHVAAKDHVTPGGEWLNWKAKVLIKFARNDSE